MTHPLEAVWARIRAEWPDVRYERRRFEAVLTGRDVPRHVEDFYLASACAAGDPAALAAFERHHLAQIASLIARIDGSAAFAGEVRQLVSERLLVGSGAHRPTISEYRGTGPLGGWVRTIAVRVARDLKRARRTATLDSRRVARAAADDNPELELVRRRDGRQLELAFRSVLSELGPRERNVLRWYFVDGMTVEAIGKLCGLNKSTITRRLAECRRQILSGIRDQLRDRLGIDADEVEGLVGLLRSRLDVSLRTLLRHTSS
jgi:RNA polymerase sigma-70 factor (ECF subfamily)